MPGFFPSTITSMSAPNATTAVVNMSKPVNPTWMEEDILEAIPAAEWAKDAANGPTLDYTNPANALKIFNFLTAQAKSVSTYASNPLWQTVDGPYKLTSFNDTTGAFTMVPNTAYSGPHATPQSNYSGVPFTSNAAEWNAVKTGSVDFGYIPQEDNPQIPQLKGLGYNYYGLPDFGDYFVAYNFKDTTGNFNAIAISCTSGRRCSTWRIRPGRSDRFPSPASWRSSAIVCSSARKLMVVAVIRPK